MLDRLDRPATVRGGGAASAGRGAAGGDRASAAGATASGRRLGRGGAAAGRGVQLLCGAGEEGHGSRGQGAAAALLPSVPAARLLVRVVPHRDRSGWPGRGRRGAAAAGEVGAADGAAGGGAAGLLVHLGGRAAGSERGPGRSGTGGPGLGLLLGPAGRGRPHSLHAAAQRAHRRAATR